MAKGGCAGCMTDATLLDPASIACLPDALVPDEKGFNSGAGEIGRQWQPRRETRRRIRACVEHLWRGSWSSCRCPVASSVVLIDRSSSIWTCSVDRVRVGLSVSRASRAIVSLRGIFRQPLLRLNLVWLGWYRNSERKPSQNYRALSASELSGRSDSYACSRIRPFVAYLKLLHLR